MRVAVPKEQALRERRVALTPDAVGVLQSDGHEIVVEFGAGKAAGHDDDEYRRAGAELAERPAVIGHSGVIVQVDGLGGDRLGEGDQSLWSCLSDGHTVVGLLDPLSHAHEMAALAHTGATTFALDLIPRSTRAQTMDVLSSMATVVGYEAALLAATRLPKMLPLMMTAAGTVPAARVVVLGAGVAGLQAIATSKRLGAIVAGYDIRPAASEQIRSLGARAIEDGSESEDAEGSGGYAREQSDETLRRQHEVLAAHVAEADAVITTAAVPGAASPELITTAMVEMMRPGSVIVDLAAERGGNCRLSEADDEVVHKGVVILGPTDLASRAASTSSRLFANNIVSFLRHLAPEGELVIDRTDEITTATLVACDGEIVNERVAQRLTNQGSMAQPSPAQRSPAEQPAGDR